jgi:predicted enzyme related to lactoylglutathione lyase
MNSNPVAWFEIYVDELQRAKKFYESVFTFKMEKLDSPAPDAELIAFPMAMGAAGAAGALVTMDQFPVGNNSTLVYFVCDDCNVEMSRVVAAGGKIQKPKMSIGQYGFIALAIDTEGNLFGMHSQK